MYKLTGQVNPARFFEPKNKAPDNGSLDKIDFVQIISLRTVGAFRKQSCGLFSAPPQELCSEDPKWSERNRPSEYPKGLINNQSI